MADIQQADVVGNYLQNYYGAQDRVQKQQAQQYNMQRQQVQDQQQAQQFDQTNQLNQLNIHKAKIDALNQLLSGIPDGNAQAFEAAKQQALAHPELGLKPEDVQNLTPKLLADDEKWQAQKTFQMNQLKGEADIAASRASTQHSLAATRALGEKPQGVAGGGAPQGYQWQRGQDGSLSLAPIKGGPADPNRVAPGEGVKVRASNASLDALEQSMTQYVKDLGKTTGLGRLASRGPEVSKVESGHTDMLLQMKNMYELGVLNGPDYMLMTKIVEDPTGYSQLARGTEGLKSQLDTVKSIISRARNINNARLGLPAAVPGVPNAGSAGNELAAPGASAKPSWAQ